MKWETVAEFSFLFGVLIAIWVGTTGVASDNTYSLLMVLGIIVGLVNIFDTHLERFIRALTAMLVCTIAFYVIATISANPMLMFFEKLSTAVALFIAPVVFVLSAIDVYEIAMEYGNRKAKAERASTKRRR